MSSDIPIIYPSDLVCSWLAPQLFLPFRNQSHSSSEIPSGKNSIKMTDLVACIQDLGFTLYLNGLFLATAIEQALSESYEQGEWHPVENFNGEPRRYRDNAPAIFRKNALVNIRMSFKESLVGNKKFLNYGKTFVRIQTLM